jgi:hypothetical protein
MALLAVTPGLDSLSVGVISDAETWREVPAISVKHAWLFHVHRLW